MKIKRNDIVKVIAGKDKAKSGKVLKILPIKNKAIVEGVNFLKRHAKKSQQNPQGGLMQKECPINISNLAIVCNRCNKPTRIGYSTLSDGTKARYCKLCKETI